MDIEDGVRFIKNKFPSTPSQNTNLTELRNRVQKILNKDVTEFFRVVAPDETDALASDKKEDFKDISVFEGINERLGLITPLGSGSYLTLYIWLLKFQNNVSQLSSTEVGEETAGLLQEVLTTNKLTTESLLKTSEKSYAALLKALKSIEGSSKKMRISYYFGGPNIFLNGCLLSYLKNDENAFIDNYESLLKYKKIVERDYKDLYMEILYGVSGYLYCFLILQTQCSNYINKPEISKPLKRNILELVNLIVNVGIKAYGSKVDLDDLPKDFRLVYNFHKKEYFGGAHGLFGILYILLKALQINETYFTEEDPSLCKRLKSTTKASLEYLLAFQSRNGSFPSRAKSHNKYNLVQFCHGSTGAIPCLLLATEIFKGSTTAEQCLNAALLAGENVWEEGIVKKGYGLCHGVSGNAYSLLAIHRHTGDIKWLYRTYCFIVTKEEKYYQDIIRSYDFDDRFRVGSADYPYSIMQGLAGDICLQIDSLFPQHGRFPGYEV